MAKAITKKITLQIPAGKATPAPPVGTVLGPAGINLQEFCTKFNDATRDKMGDIVPVQISIYEDRTFDFVLKTPPAAFLLKKVAKIKSGAAKGFIGSSGKGAKPIPLLPEEVDRILSNMGMSRIDLSKDLAEGKKVKITDGPFKNMSGKVKSYDLEKKTVELLLDLFGQETSVEVELSQIENLK